MRLTVLAAVLVASVSQAAAQDDLGDDIRHAVARVAPAVVRIRVVGTAETSGAGTISSRVTTGVVVSADGEVLTSAFGTDGNPAAIFVEDSAGQRTSAKILATDHLRKLVLLKCSDGNFQVPEFANEVPAVGAWSIAVGRLYVADHPSSSLGIVSATGRIHGLAIQTDAKVSPVNYGGPLIDLQGRVTGILVPISPQDSDTGVEAGVEWYDSGIGFAIPSADALDVATELRSGNDRLRGLLGIGLSTRNPLAEKFEVSAVQPGSPADAAELKQGDRIVVAAGRDIERFGVFESIVKSRYAGETLSLTIERGDARFDADVSLVDKLPVVERGWLGLIGQESVAVDDGRKGVRVSVVPGSPAETGGLATGAIVISIADEATSLIPEFRNATFSLKTNQSAKVEYLPDVDADETQTTEVRAAARPTDVRDFDDETVKALLATENSGDWNRAKLELDDVGTAWIFAPNPPLEKPQDDTPKDGNAAADDAGADDAAADGGVGKGGSEDDAKPAFGVILHLSAAGEPEELVLRQWKHTCERHRMILAVPKASEQRELSREDFNLVTAALSKLTENHRLDNDRIVLVADDDQQELATRLLIHPRLPMLDAAVFLGGWPRISDASSELLQRKDTAVLLIDAPDMSRERLALRLRAVQALQESGVRVSTTATAEQEAADSVARRISNWALMLKAR